MVVNKMNKDELLTISNKIVELEKEVLLNEDLIFSAELEKKEIEIKEKQLIEEQSENKDNKHLSNDTKRKLHLENMLKQNTDYLKKQNYITITKNNIEKTKIKISHLKRVLNIEIAFKSESNV
jgi:3,4-dihydroxy-2-butanone 4-phosphate synthase